MISRERHTSGGPAAALADPPDGLVSPFPMLSALLSKNGVEPSWDEVYSSISSTQQKHLIDLARQQGLLHHCPQPAPRRTGDGPPSPESARLQLLSQLFNGRTDTLRPVPAAPVNLSDSELDPCQREAVARALATPDIFLLQGRA